MLKKIDCAFIIEVGPHEIALKEIAPGYTSKTVPSFSKYVYNQ